VVSVGRKTALWIAPDNIRKAKEAEAAGYSAVIIGCHPDANLYLLRDAHLKAPQPNVIALLHSTSVGWTISSGIGLSLPS